MPEQQDTFDRPFCQTAIPRGRSRAFFVRILSPASSYLPSHPPSDFRYTFPRPPTRNFARTPHEVLLLEYRQEEHGE